MVCLWHHCAECSVLSAPAAYAQATLCTHKQYIPSEVHTYPNRCTNACVGRQDENEQQQCISHIGLQQKKTSENKDIGHLTVTLTLTCIFWKVGCLAVCLTKIVCMFVCCLWLQKNSKNFSNSRNTMVALSL